MKSVQNKSNHTKMGKKLSDCTTSIGCHFTVFLKIEQNKQNLAIIQTNKHYFWDKNNFFFQFAVAKRMKIQLDDSQLMNSL